MSKKFKFSPISTFEREMQDPAFKASFEKGYKEFLISELLLDMRTQLSLSCHPREGGDPSARIKILNHGSQTLRKPKLTMFTWLSKFWDDKRRRR